MFTASTMTVSPHRSRASASSRRAAIAVAVASWS
jgi:hypothetical protein